MWLHYDILKVKVLVIQLWTTLCDPMNCSVPGSPVYGLFQASTLENGNTGLPFPSPGDLPNPGIEPRSPALQADSLPEFLQVDYLPEFFTRILGHKGSLRILEWVAHPFTSRSSWPRNQARVSCIASGFFSNWVSRKPSTRIDVFIGRIELGVQKCTHIPIINWCSTKMPWPLTREKNSFQKMALWQLNIHIQKNEVGPFTP